MKAAPFLPCKCYLSHIHPLHNCTLQCFRDAGARSSPYSTVTLLSYILPHTIASIRWHLSKQPKTLAWCFQVLSGKHSPLPATAVRGRGTGGERGKRGRAREKRGRAFHLSFISVTQSSVQCSIQRLPSIMQNNANPLSRAFTLV